MSIFIKAGLWSKKKVGNLGELDLSKLIHSISRVLPNTSLPSYIDRAAATAAITVLLGASAGNTYLYYNATTYGIEGVRL